MKSDVGTKVRRDLRRVWSLQCFQAPKRLALDEEQVSAEVLLSVIGEVLDDPLDILRCRHENIHGLELLGLSVVGDRFNHWVQGIRRKVRKSADTKRLRTGDILLQNIELFEYRAE